MGHFISFQSLASILKPNRSMPLTHKIYKPDKTALLNSIKIHVLSIDGVNL